MGKGDKRTKRGKIWRGSHGKMRPSNATPTTKTEKVEKSQPTSKK